MSRRGREVVQERFDLAKQARAILTTLRELVEVSIPADT